MASDMNLNRNLRSVTKSAYYYPKNRAGMKGFCSKEDAEKLVHAFIFSKLDCNGVMTGLTKKIQLQLIQNSAVLTNTKKVEQRSVPRSL